MSASDLVVVDRARPELIREAAERIGSSPVAAWLSASDRPVTLPDSWTPVDIAPFVDPDAFRADFLRFLDRWPRRPCWRARSFDELFRRRGGYSVWWTSVGADRNPNRGIVPIARKAWLLDRVLNEHRPSRVWLVTADQALAGVWASRCEAASTRVEAVGGTRPGSGDPWRGRRAWLVRSIRHLLTQSIRAPLVALCARWLARTTPEPADDAEPSVVFTWRNAAYWRIDGAEVTVWFWRTVCEALARLAPQVRHRFLVRSWSHVPGRRGPAGLYHGAWRRLRHLDGALPISQAHPAYGVWLTGLPGQLRDLWRYAQVERTSGFRTSFRFAGADLAPLYVPGLRAAVASTARWGQAVASVASSLRAGGNVKAVVVAEEFYPTAMVDIAAAHSLELPVLGVQHATIFPEHLVYTLPAGQVSGAPTPDAFAAYSEFARETMCRHGAYPEERVRVTGATRLDHLATRPPDRAAARERLGVDGIVRLVLIPTQTAVWFPTAVRHVMEALRTRSDCLICIKIHPKRAAMSADAYRRLAAECGADNVQVYEDRFDELLAACDILVAASSTTVLEAILLGRTTICVNFSGEPAWYPYAEDGGSLPGHTPEELRAALGRALDRPQEVERELDRASFLRRHAGPTAHGQASSSLARVLLELMSVSVAPSSGAALSSRAPAVRSRQRA